GPEIGKRVAKADAGIEADEDGDERYGRDQDAGKSDQPAEIVGSIVYARNHLGSVTDTQTLNGRAVSHMEYGPYGEPIKSEGRTDYRSDFGYAGMQYHAASGMYLTQFRAYDPGTGRWVSRDPIGERGGINLYAYVDGNPLNRTDSLGLKPVEDYLSDWICSSTGWEDALNKARSQKMGNFDQNDPMDPDNRSAAEHYIFGRYLRSGGGGAAVKVTYMLIGGYLGYGYQGSKMIGLFPHASQSSYAQLYWEEKAYTDSIGLTSIFPGSPGNCGCEK
ncbi:RHS repeat-associated core domain-containing protein, partial [Ralstonia pseudosolanacearum]